MTRDLDRVDDLLAAWRTTYPAALTPTSELSKRIMVLAADLDEATRRVLPGLDLTVAEFDIVVALRRSGTPYHMKPNELSRSLLMSTGGTSNVTHQLVARELVERESDADDRRSTWVRLTAAGVTLAERAVRATSDAHREVFARAGEDDVRSATDALRRLFDAVESRQQAPAAARSARTYSAG